MPDRDRAKVLYSKAKHLFDAGKDHLAEGDRLLAEAREEYRTRYTLIAHGEKQWEEAEINAG